MQISWKLKSYIFSCIDYLNAPKILYFLQKYISRRSSRITLVVPSAWNFHKKNLEKFGASKTVFEFGAGKTLAQNLYLSDTVNKQVVVDLNPMIDLDLVEKTRQQMKKIAAFRCDDSISQLGILENYGIQYLAPFDASDTGFVSSSLDACISTNTLEHIPKNTIKDIFMELHRTLRDGGVVSAQIDYSDHYAHTDKSISLLNFLKYEDKEWSKYNHQCHFQNRLRHNDYIEIFEGCGFDVVSEHLEYQAQDIPPEVLKAYGNHDETWMATSAQIVLQKGAKSGEGDMDILHA